MQSPKYSIVIPTYNNCEKYLKPCIDSIIKYTEMTDIELVISANGCTDNTAQYLAYLQTTTPHIVIAWNEKPLGFAKATNRGIEIASFEKIVLLNNDTIILGDNWINKLDTDSDISAVWTQYSEITRQRFAVFFCVMIKRKVFDAIGFLNEEYETGGCEDIEFCKKATDAGFVLTANFDDGSFPIYHKAEGTVHDTNLVSDWSNKFLLNELRLSKKYNMEWYKWRLSNNYERAVFLKGDPVFPRETTRYEWAAKNLDDRTNMVEIGCSTGYGSQFFPNYYDYVGLDYDPIIIEVAKDQDWGFTRNFVHADINTYDLGHAATIVAFEVIEHLDNGLEIVEKLKAHCKRLLISVPWNEPKGFWGEHHRLHGLNESHFPSFTFKYINHHGELTATPQELTPANPSNLMLCRWDNE